MQKPGGKYGQVWPCTVRGCSKQPVDAGLAVIHSTVGRSALLRGEALDHGLHEKKKKKTAEESVGNEDDRAWVLCHPWILQTICLTAASA